MYWKRKMFQQVDRQRERRLFGINCNRYNDNQHNRHHHSHNHQSRFHSLPPHFVGQRFRSVPERETLFAQLQCRPFDATELFVVDQQLLDVLFHAGGDHIQLRLHRLDGFWRYWIVETEYNKQKLKIKSRRVQIGLVFATFASTVTYFWNICFMIGTAAWDKLCSVAVAIRWPKSRPNLSWSSSIARKAVRKE